MIHAWCIQWHWCLSSSFHSFICLHTFPMASHLPFFQTTTIQWSHKHVNLSSITLIQIMKLPCSWLRMWKWLEWWDNLFWVLPGNDFAFLYIHSILSNALAFRHPFWHWLFLHTSCDSDTTFHLILEMQYIRQQLSSMNGYYHLPMIQEDMHRLFPRFIQMQKESSFAMAVHHRHLLLQLHHLLEIVMVIQGWIDDDNDTRRFTIVNSITFSYNEYTFVHWIPKEWYWNVDDE